MNARFILILLVLLCFAGCASSDIFYWGESPLSAYELRTNPQPQTLTAHMNQLGSIIAEARYNNRRIPPGVCAELGYLLVTQKRDTSGWRFLRQEVALFPESKPFVDHLTNSIKGGTQ